MFNFINTNMQSTFQVCIILITIYSVRAQSYSAGVVVYRPFFPPDSTSDEIVRENTNSYVDLIIKNKNKVDILVFPEFGLTNIRPKDKLKEFLSAISSKVGNVSSEICIKHNLQENIVKLACAAKDNGIYVIANLVEMEGEKYYLTTVGLGPDGFLSLKCRKSHLVNGSNFENNTDEKSCTFTAKFKKHGDVPFTVLFGNDVVHPIPAAIKTENVIMTSSIKNVLPLNVGFSIYQGFAISNGINLLVSGYYEKNINSEYDNYGGSGIYYANGTSTVAFKPDGPESDAASGMVLQADIPIKGSSVFPVRVQSRLVGEITKLNLQYMNISALNDTSKSLKKCIDSKNCCEFKAELTNDTIGLYKWIAMANKTFILDQEVDIFLCALVAPSANALKSFKNITISSNVDRSQTFQSLPLALGPNISPIDFIYNNNTNEMILSKEETVAIFGLLYVVNTAATDAGSSVALIVIITLLCITLVVLLVGFLIWRKRQRKNRRAL